MKKTSKRLRKSKLFSSKLFVAALIVIGLILIANGMAGILLQKRLDNLEKGKFGVVVAQAIEGMTSDAPRDVESGRVYIPESRLIFPQPYEGMGSLRYEYSRENRSVSVTTSHHLRHGIQGFEFTKGVEEIGELIPEAQACSRHIYMAFNNQSAEDGYEMVSTKTLADGRLMTLHKSTGCAYSGDSGDSDFVSYIERVDSY